MMYENATSIAKNTTAMMASQAITWASSFILMLFLPRYLGSEDYGRLYLAISITMIFQILIDFGGSYYIAKEVSRAREKASHLVANSIFLRGILWFFSIGALALIAMFAGYSGIVTTLILVLGCAKLWEGVGRVLNSYFQGFEMMQYQSLGAITEKIFVTLAAVIALLLGGNSITVACTMAVGTLLNATVTSVYARRFLEYLPRPKWGETKRLLKAGMPYFLWSVFAVVYYRVDAVMLSLMTPESIVGWYGAAYRFFDILMFLPSIFAGAVFPVLSRLHEQSNNDRSQVTNKSLDFILLSGIPLSIIVYAFAREIIHFFFGLQEYEPSVILLQIFAIGMNLVYVDFILGTSLFASDRQRQWTMVAFGALMLNPILNYVMIPYAQTQLGNGGIGAAIATLLTELFVMMMALIIMPRDVFASAKIHTQLKGIVAGAVMAVSIALFRRSDLPWMFQGSLSVAVYLCALLSMKAFSVSEITFVRQFFSFHNLKRTFVPTSKEVYKRSI